MTSASQFGRLPRSARALTGRSASSLTGDPTDRAVDAEPAAVRPARRSSDSGGSRHVVILVENLPVPFDRRVWLECRALMDAGYRVSVVCPKGKGDPNYHVVDGVEIHKYRPYPPTNRKVGFLAEYIYSFVRTAFLTLRIWRRRRFDALQTCNPPDIFWPLGIFFRVVGGTRFVFDQHDLCPELYESRFPTGPRLPYLGIRFLERCTYRTAHHVISTNASYRQLAITRGQKRPDEVSIVRTGPDPGPVEAGGAE